MHGTVEALSSVYHFSPPHQLLDKIKLPTFVYCLLLIISKSGDYLQQVQHFEDTGAEGDDEDGDGNDSEMGTSGIIACCWRTLKTGGSLLTEVVCERGGDVEGDYVVMFGELLMETLTSVRHWGLANGGQGSFMRLCKGLLESGDEERSRLPGGWMKVCCMSRYLTGPCF